MVNVTAVIATMKQFVKETKLTIVQVTKSHGKLLSSLHGYVALIGLLVRPSFFCPIFYHAFVDESMVLFWRLL